MRKRQVKLLLAFTVVAAIAAIAVLRVSSSHAPPAQMPNPNGYDEIVRAGIAISSNFWGYEKMTEFQLRTALKTDATAIANGHEALKLPCRMRRQWPLGSNYMEQAMAATDLSEAFAAEGKLAEIENRQANAVKCYLDMVHLGNRAFQGGGVGEALEGIGLEAEGVDNLQKLGARLDANRCKEIVNALELFDSQRESLALYKKDEKAWLHQLEPGWRGTIAIFYAQWFFRKENQRGDRTYAKLQTKIRQCIVVIASRAYKLDKGSAPQRINDLVPDYLMSVPTDPSTGRAMTLPP